MPAAWAGVAVSAGSAIAGAVAGSGGASKAAGISQQAITDGNANRLTDRANYQPFVDAGTGGVNMLGNALGLNGPDGTAAARSAFTASPGYAYQVDQGLKAVDSGAAAAGMLRSGATLKAEQTLGNNLAGADFSNYLTRLNGLATLGLQGAAGAADTTKTFNTLLSGQATNQEAIAAQQGLNTGAQISSGLQGINGAVQSNGGWNALLGGGSFTGGTPTNALATMNGAGTTLGAGVGF